MICSRTSLRKSRSCYPQSKNKLILRGLRSRYFPILWLTLLFVYILAGTSSVPFHGDESTQIYMSRDYAYQFLQGNLDRLRYHDPPLSATEQQLRLLNGTLNKTLIGLAWHLGGFSVDQVNEQWDWGGDWNYNQSNNHAPSEALLQISRIPSAVLLAAGVIVIFVLGRLLGGRPVAYLASLYYALNPALLIEGRRAMMEGSLTFFSLLTVLAGIWLIQKQRGSTALLLGIAAGLALASKHTAVFTLMAVGGTCALDPRAEWVIKGRNVEAHGRAPLRIYALLLVAGVIALAIFYAMNPAWWGDPLTRAGQVLSLRSDLLTGQTAAFGGYASLSDALGGFFRQVFVNSPQYYEIPAWAGYIAEPISRYESSFWKGISIGGSVLGGVVLLLLTALGGVAAMGRKLALTQVYSDISTAQQRSESRAVRVLIFVWALVMLATTALLTPIEWQRYYLPAAPAVGLLAALGLVGLIQMVGNRLGTEHPQIF